MSGDSIHSSEEKEFIIQGVHKVWLLLFCLLAFPFIYYAFLPDLFSWEYADYIVFGVVFLFLPTLFRRNTRVLVRLFDNVLEFNVDHFARFGGDITESFTFTNDSISNVSAPNSGIVGKITFNLTDGRSVHIMKNQQTNRSDDFGELVKLLNTLQLNTSSKIGAMVRGVNVIRRIGSGVIDMIWIGIIGYILSTIIIGSSPFSGDNLYLSAAVFYALFLIKDNLGGVSPGKRMMKIRILDHKTLEPAVWWKKPVRNLTVLISILGLVEILVALFKPNRRIGDYLAGTELVLITNEEDAESD